MENVNGRVPVKRNLLLRTVNLQPPPERKKELHGGCQVNGPKVAKFLDR